VRNNCIEKILNYVVNGHEEFLNHKKNWELACNIPGSRIKHINHIRKIVILSLAKPIYHSYKGETLVIIT
jgi:hypothetical protein